MTTPPAATSRAHAVAATRQVDLRRSLNDPQLDVMNFLNEIALRYPDAISFAAGRPPEEFFDVRSVVGRIDVTLAATGALDQSDAAWNRLGAYNRTNGVIHDVLARHLAIDEDIHVPAEAIMVTVGAQEAMAVTLIGLFEPGRDILLSSDPTYVGITGLARLLGIEVVPVATSDDGLEPQRIARAIDEASQRGRVRALYDIPDFNNPLGTRMTLERRRAVLELCAARDVLIIEDNPYGLFGYDGDKLPTLKALDEHGTVLYIGSFSKTLFPALRMGYLIADQKVEGRAGLLAHALSPVKSLLTVNTSTVLQAMAAGALIASDYSLESIVREKRQALRHRRDLLLECLDESLAAHRDTVTWNRPAGGYFVAMTLPFTFGAAELQACAAAGVVVCPMQYFALGPGRAQQVRLSFGHVSDAQIREGVRRLAGYIGRRIGEARLTAADRGTA